MRAQWQCADVHRPTSDRDDVRRGLRRQAGADEAKRTKERNDQLRAQGNVSQAASDQAATAYTSANARVLVATQGAAAARAQLELVDAQLENVDLQLSRTEVTAPFAGEIVEKGDAARIFTEPARERTRRFITTLTQEATGNTKGAGQAGALQCAVQDSNL
mgnify:CR=1 FL=1